MTKLEQIGLDCIMKSFGDYKSKIEEATQLLIKNNGAKNNEYFMIMTEADKERKKMVEYYLTLKEN